MIGIKAVTSQWYVQSLPKVVSFWMKEVSSLFVFLNDGRDFMVRSCLGERTASRCPSQKAREQMGT